MSYTAHRSSSARCRSLTAAAAAAALLTAAGAASGSVAAAASIQPPAPAGSAAAPAPIRPAAPGPLFTPAQERQLDAVRRALPSGAAALVKPAAAALAQQLATAGNAGAPSVADAQKAVRGQAGTSPRLTDGDIDSLAALVLAQNVQDNESDLQTLTSDLKRLNEQKARLIGLLAKVGPTGAAPKPSPKPQPAVAKQPAAPASLLVPRRRPVLLTAALSDHDIDTAPKERLKSIAEDIQKDLDSLNELGEIESLQLQMAMDRRAKLMATLDSLLKKIADTQSETVQNAKCPLTVCSIRRV